MESTRWPARLFVTGIDTDAGKSYATGWLAREIARSGKSVITQKFVQTGNREMSEDIDVHRRITGTGLLPADLLHVTAPVIFTYPCSPELAARIDGREIDFNIIEEATDTLANEYDVVIIEGAGGLMVPLKGDYLTSDYIRDHKLPAVLVTNSKLGSISHTLLALSGMAHSGIDIFAVVYNPYFDKDKIIAEDTRNYIRKWVINHYPDTLFLEMPESI